VRYSARQLAMILGVQPSTITRDIKRGKLSASRDERGGYSIDSSEIARAYADRVTVDDAGNVAATGRTQRDATADATHATPPATHATAVLAARLEAAERLLAEREQTIEDLRRRLDGEAEERRRLTARLVDHTESPKRASFWHRLFDQLRSR
jgi:AraC-like DNA-binding protein